MIGWTHPATWVAAATAAVALAAGARAEPPPAPAQSSAQSSAQLSAQSSENVLRVCADPNNMPLSSRQGEGYENRIADLLARDLGW